MNKKSKKIISVLALALILSIFTTIAASAATSNGSLGDGIGWTYDTNTKTITVSGKGAVKNFTKSNDGQGFDKRVSVGFLRSERANKDATKVVVGEGVTSIGDFSLSALEGVTSVQLPSTIKSIGKSAFEGCKALTTINIPEGVTTIGASAFKNTKFAAVSLPYSVTSIGAEAFSGISGLKITCDYGDAAYNYCVKNSVAYVLRQPNVSIESSVDGKKKQVTVSIYLNDASGFNAGNFEVAYKGLTYAGGNDPIYTEDKDNGITSAAVFNNEGKVSIAVMASENISYNILSGKCSYKMVDLKFNIPDADIAAKTDEASFTITTTAAMRLDALITVPEYTGTASLHSFENTVLKEATCKDPGTAALHCVICGKDITSEIPIDPTRHVGDAETQNAKDPTCTEEGYTGDTVCLSCGKVITPGKVIPTIPHDYKEEIVSPTCTEAGYTAHTCTMCGDTYETDEVPALGHDYVDSEVPSTCTEHGHKVKVCSRCGDTQVGEELPLAEHTYDKGVATPPTCTKAGYTTYTCTVCGNTYKTDEVPALGHDYVDSEVPSTCTEHGHKVKVCSRCGDTQVGEELPLAKHTYDKGVATPPTCTKAGYTTYTCTVCGNTYTKEGAPATGHTNEVISETPATCTEAGSKTYKCSVCGAETTEEIPALGHDYVESETPSTCVEHGHKVYACSRCGDTYNGEELPLGDHSYEVTAETPATCTEAGSKTYKCSVCGAETTEEIPALGHDYEEKVVAPTCQSAGYTEHTCKRCGDIYRDNETEKLDHDYVSIVTPPTCTEAGYTTFTCSVCGDSYVSDRTPALGHDLDESGKCKRCGLVIATSIGFAEGSPLTADENAKVVTSKLAATTAAEFKKLISTSGWTITAADGSDVADDALVATGYIISKNDAGLSYVIVVMGDINCDGDVKAADARLALRVSAKLESNLNNAQSLAANCDDKEDVKAADARIILRVSAKLQSF